jgi:uncharacterized protein (DUF2164 family)
MARNVERAIERLESELRELERSLDYAQGRLEASFDDYEESIHAAEIRKIERKIADTQANLWALEDQL